MVKLDAGGQTHEEATSLTFSFTLRNTACGLTIAMLRTQTCNDQTYQTRVSSSCIIHCVGSILVHHKRRRDDLRANTRAPKQGSSAEKLVSSRRAVPRTCRLRTLTITNVWPQGSRLQTPSRMPMLASGELSLKGSCKATNPELKFGPTSLDSYPRLYIARSQMIKFRGIWSTFSTGP